MKVVFGSFNSSKKKKRQYIINRIYSTVIEILSISFLAPEVRYCTIVKIKKAGDTNKINLRNEDFFKFRNIAREKRQYSTIVKKLKKGKIMPLSN